ncbi:ABC transporter ATP-binding protein [Nocardia cyriacigeorgica]|uniref:Putative ABC transporter ATPase and permease component n=1 Tax=Nocardia cyriacigeorgica (strain GUH-2) TaxID=1127134 RepID=H6RDC9_NOCCG|nr:ABC transporter ATP-binding protein [Nocardia cyriacigeorgica]BDT87629.1 ABC transporter [Nocardia cyriacigeorgica]CCF63977.1 putative ABC transporter ATPase and permease component [Nocardia cyriacigeorgica GUH-2]
MIAKLFGLVDPGDRPRFLRWIAAMLGFAVLQGVCVLLLVPVLRPLLAGDAEAATPWLSALAATTIAASLVYYTQAMLGQRIGDDLLLGLHHRVADQLARMPLGWFDTDRTGRLTHAMSQGTTNIIAVPAHLMQPVIAAVTTPVVVALGMFVFDARLAVALLIAGLVLLVTHTRAREAIARSFGAIDDAEVEAASRVVEFAKRQPVLRAFGRAGTGNTLLDDALTGQRRAYGALTRKAVSALVAFSTAVQAAFVALIALGVVLALGGSLEAAELIALLVLVTRFAGPLIEMVDHSAALRIAAETIDRIDEVLAVPALPEGSVRKATRPGEVALHGVGFGYGDQPVLRDVEFTAAPGTLTAIVGPSGSGKTTLLRLMARFWDADSGTVCIGGVDVRQWRTDALMHQLAMVFQDVYLFDDTIAENIRIGRPEATDAEVRAAARLARVDEIVERLPDGWNTRVGEGGASLSGGERQRVSIARALVKQAPIVLFDEATAALDPENEAAITDAMRALAADRTLLVVAHRLHTIAAADQILVLDAGRIVQRGTHDELIDRPGKYAEFWRERERAQGWRVTG